VSPEELYEHSMGNRAEVEASALCGCFFCKAIFAAAEVTEYYEEEETALCPQCGFDAVIGSAAGAEITSELLGKMQKLYFW